MKLPKCNGRPQLWHSVFSARPCDRLRIIYPSGLVKYAFWNSHLGYKDFKTGCTSRRTQIKAVQAAQQYSSHCGEDFVFLGYL